MLKVWILYFSIFTICRKGSLPFLFISYTFCFVFLQRTLRFMNLRRLEYVEIFLPRRKRENFIFGKANFAVGCGRSGEKFNAAENKIFHLQPGKENLNMLLGSIFGKRLLAPTIILTVRLNIDYYIYITYS